MAHEENQTWQGLRAEAQTLLDTRDYSLGDLAQRLAGSGVNASEAMAGRPNLADAWIPGVEIFPRRVFQQKGRGYFGELTRTSEGILNRIGLTPRQWGVCIDASREREGLSYSPASYPGGHHS